MDNRSKSTDAHHWAHYFRPELFAETGEKSVSTLMEYLVECQNREASHVLDIATPESRLEHWKSRLNDSQSSSGSGLFKHDFLEQLLCRSNHLHDPRYAGHQVAVPFPELAWLSAATALLNNGMAIDEMGPASTPMEEAVMQSIAQYMGFGTKSGGILCHGGTLANLTALLAARQKKAVGNAWEEGVQTPCAVLVSDQAHYCVDRAVRVMGWGKQGIIEVATDDQHQMSKGDLYQKFNEATAAGIHVVAVVGSACTTSTGAFDDLEMIADFAEAHDVWFHVDGAHGAAQVFSSEHRNVLKGMERADSVAMDFHKMLGVPALCTGLFYKDGIDAYGAFSHEAAYLYESQNEEWWNLSKRTFECTKRMLSASVFGIWEAHGPLLWESLVVRLISRAQFAAAQLNLRDNWEVFAHPKSNILCFRLKGVNNSNLRAKLLKHGPHYIVKTRVNGSDWLRCTFQNPLTTEDDIIELIDRLEELA
ncbi:MAG: pyridoxal phosphate-dependent decarboxylase family protein [Flavobacteriales bacterium]